MLSKIEKECLSDKYTPTNSHRRFLDHKIKKKIKEIYRKELLFVQNSHVSDFSNILNEFVNNKIICEATCNPIYEGK